MTLPYGKIVRPKKYMTVQEWKRFEWFKQEILCKKYDVILTDHKSITKKSLKNTLKKFNMKNFDKGMNIFNKGMQDFGKAMDDMTRELGGEGDNGTEKIKKKVPLWSEQKISLGKSLKVWSEPRKSKKKKQTTKKKKMVDQDTVNLEKIWGKKK